MRNVIGVGVLLVAGCGNDCPWMLTQLDAPSSQFWTVDGVNRAPTSSSIGFRIYEEDDHGRLLFGVSGRFPTEPQLTVRGQFNQGVALGRNVLDSGSEATLYGYSSNGDELWREPLSGFLEVSALGVRRCESYEQEFSDTGRLTLTVCGIDGLQGALYLETTFASKHHDVVSNFTTSQVLSENCASSQ